VGTLDSHVFGPQKPLVLRELIFRGVLLLLAVLIKLALASFSIVLTREDSSIAPYTQMPYYFSSVLVWPFVIDLATMIVYFATENSKEAKDPVLKREMRNYVYVGFIFQNLVVYGYFLVCYYGLFALYASTFGGRLSGHWLAISLHNYVLVKNLVFQHKVKENDLNRYHGFFSVLVYVLLILVGWTLFWTTMIYHTVFECVVGYAVGSVLAVTFYSPVLVSVLDRVLNRKGYDEMEDRCEVTA